jgi:hypothetical protein
VICITPLIECAATGNSFMGGLGAGLMLTQGDVYKGTYGWNQQVNLLSRGLSLSDRKVCQLFKSAKMVPKNGTETWGRRATRTSRRQLIQILKHSHFMAVIMYSAEENLREQTDRKITVVSTETLPD